MGKAEDKTLDDFGGDLDAYVAYRAEQLGQAVEKVARQNNITPQQALDAMFKASVQHAKTLRRNRLAQRN